MKSGSNINIILTNEYFEPGFQKLKDSGLNTFHFPMIKTKSVINEIKINLDLIDCIIFVSKNGVRYFFENENTKKYDLSNKYFVCIGKKTANKLIKTGYKPRPITFNKVNICMIIGVLCETYVIVNIDIGR